jgi:hypothetical protein
MFSSRIINSKQLRTTKSLIIIVILNLKGYTFFYTHCSIHANRQVNLGPSYTIPDSHRSDIKFYCYEVNLALKIMII